MNLKTFIDELLKHDKYTLMRLDENDELIERCYGKTENLRVGTQTLTVVDVLNNFTDIAINWAEVSVDPDGSYYYESEFGSVTFWLY